MAPFAGDRRINWVEQKEQLGTGHAAQSCIAELKKIGDGNVFILAGDGPLIRGEVLTTLLQAHLDDAADASMATAVLDDPTGYGRVIRDANGEFIEIIEQPDATPEQREIREVFPSYYCVKIDALLFALSKLKNNNKKGEYYLTDIYGILRAAGKKNHCCAGCHRRRCDRRQHAPSAGGCGRHHAGADSTHDPRSRRDDRQFRQYLHRSGCDDRSGFGDRAVHVHRPRQPGRARLHDRAVCLPAA